MLSALRLGDREGPLHGRHRLRRVRRTAHLRDDRQLVGGRRDLARVPVHRAGELDRRTRLAEHRRGVLGRRLRDPRHAHAERGDQLVDAVVDPVRARARDPAHLGRPVILALALENLARLHALDRAEPRPHRRIAARGRLASEPCHRTPPSVCVCVSAPRHRAEQRTGRQQSSSVPTANLLLRTILRPSSLRSRNSVFSMLLTPKSANLLAWTALDHAAMQSHPKPFHSATNRRFTLTISYQSQQQPQDGGWPIPPVR